MRKNLLFYCGCALIAGGALALVWYARMGWDLWRTQISSIRRIEPQNKQYAGAPHPEVVPHVHVILPPRAGEPVGKIEIPRLGLSVVVLEGDDSNVLRVAAGHVPGTALPDSTGNVAIAAHRDTFFRPLRGIHPQDEIAITTSYGTYRYRVERTEIVDPTDIQVLNPTKDPELTLVTCYPFSYIGPAPKRFIVHARLESAKRIVG